MKDSNTAKDVPQTFYNFIDPNLTAMEIASTDELFLLKKILSELRQLSGKIR